MLCRVEKYDLETAEPYKDSGSERKAQKCHYCWKAAIIWDKTCGSSSAESWCYSSLDLRRQSLWHSLLPSPAERPLFPTTSCVVRPTALCESWAGHECSSERGSQASDEISVKEAAKREGQDTVMGNREWRQVLSLPLFGSGSVASKGIWQASGKEWGRRSGFWQKVKLRIFSTPGLWAFGDQLFLAVATRYLKGHKTEALNSFPGHHSLPFSTCAVTTRIL